MPAERATSAIVTQQGANYTATCPEFGIVEQGTSKAEAIANLCTLSSAYLSIILPEIDPRSIRFEIVDRAAVRLLHFPQIGISACATIRILERMGFSRVRGLMVMQKNLADNISTCAIPLHHRTLKATTLQAILEQAQIPTQDLAINL